MSQGVSRRQNLEGGRDFAQHSLFCDMTGGQALERAELMQISVKSGWDLECS